MYADIAVRSLTCHTATGTHMPYRITQCYLLPDRGLELRLLGLEVRVSVCGQGWVIEEELVLGW